MDRPNPGYDDNIIAGEKLVLVKAIDLPQPPADLVTDHSVTQLGPRSQASALQTAAPKLTSVLWKSLFS